MADPEGQQEDYSFRPVPRAGRPLRGEDRTGLEAEDVGLLSFNSFALDVVDESLAETIHEPASPSPRGHAADDEQRGVVPM